MLSLCSNPFPLSFSLWLPSFFSFLSHSVSGDDGPLETENREDRGGDEKVKFQDQMLGQKRNAQRSSNRISKGLPENYRET